jgi:chemotaxis protein methyltransferase CheR
MREPQQYKFLSDTILPELGERFRRGELRVWSAGCSSGEEPFSIAITLKKYFQSRGKEPGVRILATDISDNVLTHARSGRYAEIQLKDLDPDTRLTYFKKLDGGMYQASDELRRMVRFEKFNLMHPFTGFYQKFHIIFCRNVMIYFKHETKQELVAKFFDKLEPGGYFFVGLSETLHNVETRFEYVRPAIYRKPPAS